MIERAISLDGRKVLRFSGGLKVRQHNLVVFCGLVILAVFIAMVSASIGTTQTTLAEVFRVLSGASDDQDLIFAIWDVRLPRILLGFLAGCSVALAGAMLQSIAQNPLSDPGLLGISQGSVVAILLAMVFVPALPPVWMPGVALTGGLGVALMILLLVGGSRAGGITILLMGIAIETTLSSLTSILILYTPPEASISLSAWLAGSLFQADWAKVTALTPWFLLCVLAVFAMGRAVRSYDLGDHIAMALGENIARSRPILLILAVMLTSAALVAVGPLMFLGIMAPHIAGFISPASGRARLALAALIGGILVIGADTITRAVVSDIALPVGLSLTLIGAPVFIITMRLRSLRSAQTHR